MDSNPLAIFDSRGGDVTGRLAEILGASRTLPAIPDILLLWLQDGGAQPQGPLVGLILVVVGVAGILLARGTFLALARRRGGPASEGSLRRPAFAWLVGFAAAVLVFLVAHPWQGALRQLLVAVFGAVLLAQAMNGLAEALLARRLRREDPDGEQWFKATRRQLRLCSGLAFGGLALGLVLHQAGVPDDTRLLADALLLILLALFLIRLIQQLRRGWIILPPLGASAGQETTRRDLMLSVFARTWRGFHLGFVVIILLIALGYSLLAGELALLRGWASLLLFALVPLVLVLWEELLSADEGLSPWRRTAVHGLQLVTVALAWYGLAHIWGLNLLSMAHANLGTLVADAMIDIAIILLLTHLVWEVIRTAIDVHAGGGVAPGQAQDLDDGTALHGTQAASRLQTFAPLLRKFMLVVLVVVATCLVVSAMGVEIGPLLAGAGVVGIALGFGAQTLVRDVVAGIFYLLDDAFRIGEYVEIGETMGTVEGMSIRSLRLRHQQGMVHTVPFGEIAKLTNFSRDWAIIKLQFLLSFDTDVEKVRKLVKKVNLELQADPTYGPTMLGPVKSQGVRGTTPIGLIIGVKFTAKPGTQFPLRKEVYRRVRDKFIENGVQFARPNVLVQTASPPAAAPAVAGSAEGSAPAPGSPPPDEARALDDATAAAAAKAALDHMEEKTS